MTQFRYRFFFILISSNIKVLLILHTKFQPNIRCGSAENADFNGFTIFSIGGHLELSTRLNLSILKSWSLIMLHVKFEVHGCSGLNVKVDVNCEQTDGRTVVVVLLFYVHGKHLRSCLDGQLTQPHFSWAGLDLLSG